MVRPIRQDVPPPSIEDFVGTDGVTLLELWVVWSGAAYLTASAIETALRHRPDLPIRVGRVDADAHPEVCRTYAIEPPGLLLFENGTLVARRRGLVTGPALLGWLTDSTHLLDEARES